MAGEKRVLAHVLFLEVNGVGRFIPHGAVVPAGVDPEVVESLEGQGHVGVLPTDGGVPVTPAVPEGEPSESWTVVQIDAYLVEHGLPVVGRKAEKLAAIAAANTPAPEVGPDESTDDLGFIEPPVTE